MRLDVAQIGVHQVVHVDDAGGGRDSAAGAASAGSSCRIAAASIRLEIGQAVLLSPRLDGRELGDALLTGADGRGDHLAEPAMADAMLGAIAIKQRLAAAAEPSLELADVVIDAGVNDAGIARSWYGCRWRLRLPAPPPRGPRWRAPARSQSPTTPAPTTTQSTLSVIGGGRLMLQVRWAWRFKPSPLRGEGVGAAVPSNGSITHGGLIPEVDQIRAAGRD